MTTNAKNLVSDEMFRIAAEAWFSFELEEGRSDFPEQLRAALQATIAPMLAQEGDAVSDRPKFTLSQEFVDRIQSEQSYDSPDVIGADISHCSPIMQVLENYFDEYEFSFDDGVYTPNADERMLIKDAVYGLIEDEDFLRVITLMHKTPPHDDGKVARDAERYRFLRECKSDAYYVMAFDPEGDAPCLGGEIMDNAIDAAIKEQRSPSQSTGSHGDEGKKV